MRNNAAYLIRAGERIFAKSDVVVVVHEEGRDSYSPRYADVVSAMKNGADMSDVRGEMVAQV